MYVFCDVFVGEALVARQDWLSSVATVAAYRDRFGVTSDAPLGPGARTDAERADRRRALAAQRKALVVARTAGVAVRSAPIASHLRR